MIFLFLKIFTPVRGLLCYTVMYKAMCTRVAILDSCVQYTDFSCEQSRTSLSNKIFGVGLLVPIFLWILSCLVVFSISIAL